MKQKIIIKKASGEEEPFSEEKLRYSLKKAGILDSVAHRIIEHVSREAREGMRSSDIHRHVINLLKRDARGYAARYNLKRAIMDLGPTGHPFEKFVGEILKNEGYSVETNVITRGRCVTHEIDIAAVKEKRRVMVECKFHNQPGAKSDVKVALYVRARFEDVSSQFNEVWLVTNTKLTSDAIRFSNCSGIRVIGWNYPREASLQHLIETFELYPITSLVTPTREEQRRLIEHGVTLVRQLRDDGIKMAVWGIPESRAAWIRAEALELLRLSQNKTTAF